MILQNIFDSMKTCPQRKDYHPEGDVYTHTAYVMDFFHREDFQMTEREIETLEYAIIFHDMGKIDCTKRNPKHGKWASYGHASIGTRYVDLFQEMIPHNVTLVRWIVKNHMKIKFRDNLSSRKLDTLKNEFGKVGWDLLNAFNKCDDMLSYLDITSQKDRDRALQEFDQTCNELVEIEAETYNPFGYNTDNKSRGHLILLRGVPGSGKTTLAKSIQPDFRVSADDFFMVNGNYEFDASKLKEAHNWCQTEVWNYMSNSDSSETVICVDNTFTQLWEMVYYYQAAYTHGFTVSSVIVENRHGGTSTSGISEDKVDRMRERFNTHL